MFDIDETLDLNVFTDNEMVEKFVFIKPNNKQWLPYTNYIGVKLLIFSKFDWVRASNI